mgnify:CR=1 FL=1
MKILSKKQLLISYGSFLYMKWVSTSWTYITLYFFSPITLNIHFSIKLPSYPGTILGQLSTGKASHTLEGSSTQLKKGNSDLLGRGQWLSPVILSSIQVLWQKDCNPTNRCLAEPNAAKKCSFDGAWPEKGIKIWPFEKKLKPNLYFWIFSKNSFRMNSTHPFYPISIPNSTFVKFLFLLILL